jgi:hypothetical protein
MSGDTTLVVSPDTSAGAVIPPMRKSPRLTLPFESYADRGSHAVVTLPSVMYDSQLLVGLEKGPTPKRLLHLVEDDDSLVRRHRRRGGDDPTSKCGSDQ